MKTIFGILLASSFLMSAAFAGGDVQTHVPELRKMLKGKVADDYLEAKVQGMARLVEEWSKGDAAWARDIVLALGRMNAGVTSAKPEGIGVVVLVDTSGSMDVPPAKGVKGRPKKIVSAGKAAARALNSLQGFGKQHPERKLQVGLASFDSQVKELISFQPMTAAFPQVPKLKAGGGTAIGEALIHAKLSLDKAGVKQQHIVLITDGQNSTGVKPLPVIQAFNLMGLARFPMLHFIAFDIDADRFRDIETLFLKRIYEAADAEQLDRIIDNLLAKEILAESKSL